MAIIIILVIVIYIGYSFFSWRERERNRLSGGNQELRKFYTKFYNSPEYKEYEKKINEMEKAEKEQLKRKYNQMRDVF
jgi:predicted negative regulator of RcsB-dependent stress response